MADFINTTEVIGDDAVVDGILEGTLTEYKDNRVAHTGYYSFHNCRALTTVIMPNATTVGRYTFNGCSGLKTVDLASVTYIALSAFVDCSALTALILRGDTVCTLENTNAFNSTPIAKGTGYIYVPRALLSDTDETKDYRRATNLSTFAAQFRALEDYTVDGTTTGELDETKIAA